MTIVMTNYGKELSVEELETCKRIVNFSIKRGKSHRRVIHSLNQGHYNMCSDTILYVLILVYRVLVPWANSGLLSKGRDAKDLTHWLLDS